MSDNRSDRSSSNRDYIPLENSVSARSTSTDSSSSSDEVDISALQPLLPLELRQVSAGVAGNGGVHSDIIASGDSEEVNGVIEVAIVRIPSEISSGYLGSNESSTGVDGSGIPTPTESTATPSSSETISIESDCGVDLATFVKSLIVSVSEDAVDSVESETGNVPEIFNPSPPIIKSLNNLRRSQSVDSFFAKINKVTTTCMDDSNLYRMTINIKNPYEYVSLGDSASLESVMARRLITNRPADCSLECADYQGDSDIISLHQLQKETENAVEKKFDRDTGRMDRWTVLRNINALFPTNMETAKYDVYVNEEKKSTEKQDKFASKSTTFNTVTQPNTDTISKEDMYIPRSVSGMDKSVLMNMDVSEMISFYCNASRSIPKIRCIENFIEENPMIYKEAVAKARLIRRHEEETNNRSADRNTGTKVLEDTFPSFISVKNDTCSNLTKESAERTTKLSANFNSISPNTSEETKEMAELFYLGDLKPDPGENLYTSSETFESLSSKESSGSSKWNATTDPDVNNNNYILSQTSSDDSIEYDNDCKFQFTKDISGKEEYLRQDLTLSEEQLYFQNERRRRVSFNNDYPIHFPARQNYLRTRKLDFSPKSPSKSTVDVASATEFFNESQDEIRRFSDDYALQQKIINEAEKSSYKLLRDLQCLWMNITDMGCLPSITPQTIMGDHNLIQHIQLCIFIVDQMNQNQDWRTSADITGTEKLQELQNANKNLKEQLDSCRIIQNCLESEINYAAKEKALLNDEVKHLSYQLATRTCKLEKSLPVSPIISLRKTDGTGSNSPDFDLDKSQEENIVTNENEIPKPNFAKKREEDFSSIMDCVRDRKGVMDTLNTQLDKYQEDVVALKRQIEKTNVDKEKLYLSYETLVEEKKIVLRERNSYESLLKLILNQKANNGFNLQDLLERVITKISTFTSESDGKSSSFHLLEGALQAVQEQNICHREEINQLKERISSDTEHHLLVKNELESSFQKVSQKVEELKHTIEDKAEFQKSQDKKLSQLHELETIASQAKDKLDKSLEEKDIEIAKLREAFEESYKSNVKQQRKVHELQKLNAKLTRETHEHRRNIEQLGSIVNQLRQSLADQKTQYSVRVNSVGDEAVQSKEHCRWLQSQIDYMNSQLEEAHARIQAQERDKSSLAQQVLSAEEERKVVDRNLNELKSALEGDMVLRQALMERNETLQMEINRLRRAKITSGLSPLMSSVPSQLGEFGNPPSEFSSITEGLSSLISYPLSDYKPLTVGERRKNRHSTPYRKGNDAPRIAVSLHNATGASGNGNNSVVDINAGGAGAACSPPNE